MLIGTTTAIVYERAQRPQLVNINGYRRSFNGYLGRSTDTLRMRDYPDSSIAATRWGCTAQRALHDCQCVKRRVPEYIMVPVKTQPVVWGHIESGPSEI